MLAVRALGRTLRLGRRTPPVAADDVRRAYQLMLGRAPDSESLVKWYVAEGVTLEELFRKIARSAEFAGRWAESPATIVSGIPPVVRGDEEVIRSFPQFTGSGRAGFVTDFLGTRTRTEFVKTLAGVDGSVEGYPFPGNFHSGSVEWAGSLRAVLDASERFVAVELGAGWGPWLVATAAAAWTRGITEVKLVGVEGAESHVAFMRDHFRDNGLDPDAHTLLHGVAAEADGWMEFPELDDPADSYGGSVADPQAFVPRLAPGATRPVRAYSIGTLLEPFDAVDLLHIDIQGSEAAVVRSAREVMRRKVRRTVIGTHSRAIEQQLMEDLSADGWVLEAEEACKYHRGGTNLTMWADGTQVWRNPAV